MGFPLKAVRKKPIVTASDYILELWGASEVKQVLQNYTFDKPSLVIHSKSI